MITQAEFDRQSCQIMALYVNQLLLYPAHHNLRCGGILRDTCKAKRLKLYTGMLCIQFVFICLQIVSKKGDRVVISSSVDTHFDLRLSRILGNKKPQTFDLSLV